MPGSMKSMIDPLPRAGAEQSLFVKLDGDRIEQFQLRIPEPSRLFASELVGKDPREAPAAIERLWGRSPVSYQIPACEALEAAMDVEVTPAIRQLRRLLYCAEWIESHALHVYLLAPDFLGDRIATTDRAAIESCPRLKRVGDALMAVLSGSAQQPNNIAVGGFHHAPRAFELAAMRTELAWAVEASVEITRFVAALDFPRLDLEYVDYEMVCLHQPDQYPINE
jgi:coenzyme F420-reducing hydrogenase alpha subunit